MIKWNPDDTASPGEKIVARERGPYYLHICRDGTVTVRARNEPVFNGRALPFFSAPTREDAKALQAMMCKLAPQAHPDLPGQPWYYLPGFAEAAGRRGEFAVVELVGSVTAYALRLERIRIERMTR